MTGRRGTDGDDARALGLTVPARWALGVAVLLLGVVIAMWPRDGQPEPQAGPDLEAARAKAALPGCAAPDGRNPAPELGVGVRCLADGSRLDLARAVGGRTTLVNVWASWCAPCREELPVLRAYSGERGAARVVGLHVDDEEHAGLRLLTELGVRLPTVHDADGAASRALRVPAGLPASYLITPDGRVNFVERPRVFHKVGEVRDAVARYAVAGKEGR